MKGVAFLIAGFGAGMSEFLDVAERGAQMTGSSLLMAGLILLGVVIISLDRRRERERAKERDDAAARHKELLDHHNAFIVVMTSERAAMQAERLATNGSLIHLVQDATSQSKATESAINSLKEFLQHATHGKM